MSLVEAQDGRFYHAPLWYGIYGDGLQWFLNRTFDLELKVEVLSKHDKNAKKNISMNLESSGFSFKLAKPEFWDAQPFPPSWCRKKSFNYLFTPLSALPIPTEYDAVFDTPDYNDLKYCWSVPFRVEDIWAFFQKEPKKLNQILGTFILGKMYVDTTSMQIAVKNKLKRQYNFAKADLQSLLAQYGQCVKVRRQ